MVCDRRILLGGWWHIRRARGDLAGDVHRGCAVARNVEGERAIYVYIYIHTGRATETEKSRNSTLWNLRMVFFGGCIEKTHGKLYPGRKVAVAMQFMLGALQKVRACRNIVSVLILYPAVT